MYDVLQDLVRTTVDQCWDLHKKLSGEYSNSNDQLKDMVRLGELAKLAQTIQEAASASYTLKVQQ